jgi:hypothetical protein
MKNKPFFEAGFSELSRIALIWKNFVLGSFTEVFQFGLKSVSSDTACGNKDAFLSALKPLNINRREQMFRTKVAQ